MNGQGENGIRQPEGGLLPRVSAERADGPAGAFRR